MEAAIFEAAMAVDDELQRRAMLDAACRGDPELRKRVAELLAASENARSFMQEPAVELSDETLNMTTTEMAGAQIGCYKLLQRIGEGGFGVVYMAEQQSPIRRKVALKVIKLGMDTREVVARFEAERQALALMDHPNIARVLDAGETESGRPYFAMELVKGVPITEFCDTNKLTNEERLKLFVAICQGVQHAHQKGIIHRDLKPNNVMVTLHDNKPVPKIIDFGVAKALSQQLTEKTLFTRYGQMIGTPIYMSPEQAQMSGLDVDTRSDVYSLGVLLFELLTGTTPISREQLRATGYAEVQRLIAEEEAPTPSARISTLGDQKATIATYRSTDVDSLQRTLRGDIDWIVAKSLEKDRGRRYESAGEFANDVRRYLSGEEVLARPPSLTYKLGKLVRRYRTLAVAGSLIFISLSLGLLGTSLGMFWARKSANEARSAQDVAVRKSDEATEAGRLAAIAQVEATEIAEERRRQLYASNLQRVNQLWDSPAGTLPEIRDILTAWIPVDSKPDLREFAWRHQWTRLFNNASQRIENVSSVAISPRGNFVTADEEGVKEWGTDGEVIANPWSGDASRTTLSPRGDTLLLKTGAERRLIEVASGQTLRTIRDAAWHKFSSNGRFLASWQRLEHGKNLILIFDIEQKQLIKRTPPQLPEIVTPANYFAMSPIEESFAVYVRGDDRAVAVIGDASETLQWTCRDAVNEIEWSRDGRFLAIGEYTGRVHIRDSGVKTRSMEIDSAVGGKITALCFSHDDQTLFIGKSNGLIEVCNVSTFTAPSAIGSCNAPASNRTLKAHLGAVEKIVAHRHLSKLISLGDGVAKVWNLESESEGRSIVRRRVNGKSRAGSDARSFRVSFAPSGSQLTVADIGAGASTWSSSGNFERPYSAQGISAAYSPDGHWLALDHFDRVELRNGMDDDGFHVQFDLKGHEGVGVHRSERLRLATLKSDGTERQLVYSTPDIRWASVAFSKDSRYLALTNGVPWCRWGSSASVQVYDLEALPEMRCVLEETRKFAVVQMEFTSRDELVCTDIHGLVTIWNINDWSVKRTFPTVATSSGGISVVRAMALSPDNDTIAIGGGRGLSLWDLSTGELVRILGGQGVNGIDWLPDGRTIATVDENHRTILWDASSGAQLQVFSDHRDVACGVDYSPVNSVLATTGNDGVLVLRRADRLEAIDRNPLTLEAMLQLGRRHNQRQRFAKADAVLRRALEMSAVPNLKDVSIANKLRTALIESLKGGGTFPRFEVQPLSQQAELGKNVRFHIRAEPKDLAIQWFHEGRPIRGATQDKLNIQNVATTNWGRYHVEIADPDDDVRRLVSDDAYLVDATNQVIRGALRREIYALQSKFQLEDLLESHSYPHQPDRRDYVRSWESVNAANVFGLRLTGFVVPPQTGEYRFYLSADNQAQLSVSTDANPDNGRVVATTPIWQPAGEWETLPAGSISQPLHLVGGQRYWVETILVDNGGVDHVSVAWQLPGGDPPQNGAAPISGEYLEYRPQRTSNATSH